MEKKVVVITNSVTVDELARALMIPVTDLIGGLFKNGIMATINQRLDFETVSIMIDELGLDVELKKKETALVGGGHHRVPSEHAVRRPPIVAVMGHVDHGKTTLLDTLLNKKTADGEAGGITQHIAAYQVNHDGRLITFLDTPGHSAFQALRQHSAALTDIVVLVVAADDGVKPQTIEAIEFARSANAKIIVAINKIDKPEADVSRVMAELSEHNLQPEEWGGNTITVAVSAKQNEGLDKLLDMILLTADIDELKADEDGPAEGLVIESHMEVGKGAVVNLLVTSGTLFTGEFLVAGKVYGKVRVMLDFKGSPKGKATPATPVKVTGFKELPNFGDYFKEATDEKEARKTAAAIGIEMQNELATTNTTGLDLLRKMSDSDNKKRLNIVVKADVQGSVTSIVDNLKMIDTKGLVDIQIVGSGVGNVSENDVRVAVGGDTIIYGFSVELPASIKRIAARDNVSVRIFNVIYELLDDVKKEIESLLPPEVIETEMGELAVRGVFRTSRSSVIAGGEVLKGKIASGYKLRVVRKHKVIAEAEVDKVQREKIEVSEAVAGEMCGLSIKTEHKINLEVGDRLELFIREVKPQKL
ncbi:MAG: translation initiation factor IF-2 [Candidatus Nomurabacteria bacterium]|jgi:translation initiation factor IF-2|nr:translation initiation factor IF-2 [Candidatus Nomurabacteria bacterium]